MWYLILATCTGTVADRNLECTEAEIISHHITQKFCTDESEKYSKAGTATFCMEVSSVTIKLPPRDKVKT